MKPFNEEEWKEFQVYVKEVDKRSFILGGNISVCIIEVYLVNKNKDDEK